MGKQKKTKKNKKKKFMPIYIRVILCLLIVMVVTAIVIPYVYPIDLGATDLINRLAKPKFMKPSSPYLLGTDALGRDLFVRILYGLRNSLIIATSGLVVAAALGILLGVLGGMCGGWVDAVITTLVDVRMALPTTLIGIVCAAIFSPSKGMVIMVIGFTQWSGFARLIRAQIKSIKKSQFLEASRSIGSSSLRIVCEHIMVNIASPIIIQATLTMSHNITLESTLSYLGLGISEPDTSLGLLIANGRQYMVSHAWLTLAPVVVTIILIMCCSLLGDWMRDALDPKMKGRG